MATHPYYDDPNPTIHVSGNGCNCVACEVDELHAWQSRASEVLRRCEWAGPYWPVTEEPDDQGAPTCPLCGALEPYGHESNCDLKSLLRSARRQR